MRTSGKYILINKKPIQETDLMKWAEWYEKSNKERIVKQEDIDKVRISTVFLGIDYSFLFKEPPLLFETMIFGGKLNQKQDRYSTWDEAIEGHEKMKKRVEKEQSK